MIYYQNDSNYKPNIPKRKIKEWIQQVAETKNYQVGAVSYIFCTDERILELNKSYLQHDYFTDVLTFDYTTDKTISGDIFISLDTIASNAALYKVTFYHELYRVMIHGILHLCQIKDTTPQQRKRMSAAENDALYVLKSDLKVEYDVQI